MKYELFIRVFYNKLLFKIIFLNVQSIHRNYLNIDKLYIYKWEQLKTEQIHILAYHNYLNELKENAVYHNIIKFIDRVGPKYGKRYSAYYGKPMTYAIRGDAINVLAWTIQNYPHLLAITVSDPANIKNIGDLMYFASLYGSLKTIDYLDSNEINKMALSISSTWSWNYLEAFKVSPLSNNMEIFQYFASKTIDLLPERVKINDLKIPLKKRMVYVAFNAAYVGNLDMLKMFLQYSQLDNLEQMFKLDSKHDSINVIIRKAIEGGHLNIVQYVCSSLSNMITQGITLHLESNLINLATIKNRLEIIKCIHPFVDAGDEVSLENAIYGNLELVKWLHANRENVHCTEIAMNLAVSQGYLDIVQWLHNNRTEGCTEFAFDSAISNNDLEMLQWLHKNRTEGCSPDIMDHCTGTVSLEVLKYAFSNLNVGCTTLAMDIAAEEGNLEVLKWLHENRTEGCTTDAFDNAALRNKVETVKWLISNRSEGFSDDGMKSIYSTGFQDIIILLQEYISKYNSNNK